MGRLRSAGHVRVGVRPAAGPARAVVRHDEDVFVGRVIFNGPHHKIDQRLRIGHVDLAHVLNQSGS
jgi:hypothetical protein